MGRHSKVSKEQLLETLKRNEGDFIKTAVDLGVSLSTIYRSADRYSIEVTTKRRVKAA